MKRKTTNQINIWPGFVDAITTLLLVFVFLLAVFMISQTFLTLSISGKNAALEGLRAQLKQLDIDLNKKEKKNIKLSELIITLNQQIDSLNLDKDTLKNSILEKESESKSYVLNIKQLENKVALLFEELGIEKLNLEAEKKSSQRLNLEISELNDKVSELNQKLTDVQNALSISAGETKTKEIEIKDLKLRLDTALKQKIGELSEYRSEFFGKLKEILKDQKKINVVGDRFVLQSEILFKSGSAKIGIQGEKRLSEITALLKSITKKIPKKIDWIIQVEGHTDNVPISNDEFPSNWELSVARAIAVSKIMIDNGIEPKRINVAGYGEFRPLVENLNDVNKNKNRRIELKLTQP
ncbi:MAG: peptidoglycan -binding protein [Pseudomonadota bacterium]|nr:peptidoglycan -binding protein [Pseudomonadota bacterium]